MAPAQLNGGDVDTRAAIFAFGCVYEMLTGKGAASVIVAMLWI